MKDVNIGGYKLSLTKTKAFLNATGTYTVEGLKLETEYTLKRDQQYEAVAGNHKIVVEFVNQDTNKLTFSKTFNLGSATSGGTDEVLKEGDNLPLKMVFNDTDIQSKLITNEKFKLNIYDMFQNSKLLIASKELQWFLTNN